MGDPSSQHIFLPPKFVNSRPVLAPTAILHSRSIFLCGRLVTQVLVQWATQSHDDATWETLSDFRRDHPDFQVEDKLVLNEGSNVAPGPSQEPKDNQQVPGPVDSIDGPAVARRSERARKRTKQVIDSV
ncbi:hypothetical protein Scep_011623 [Stephania cephalantha]|uniref:Chromo domain-containing protein n=1 Tax=Stephania cephalantha TaxID=152367 RepID=A0AAP0JEH6_9MAGN